MDAAHPGKRRAGVGTLRQIRSFAQIHAILDVDRAVKNAAFLGSADENALPITGKEAGAAFFGNVRRCAGKILFQCQENAPGLLLHDGQCFNADGNSHADKEIILKVFRRLPDHF